MNGKAFCEYLKHIRNQIPTVERIYLIYDMHASHRRVDVKAAADSILNKAVVGILQSETLRLFHR
jgi:hypothetical protein